MIVPGLSNEDQSFFNKIISNNAGTIQSALLQAQDSTIVAQTILNQINKIIKTIGELWNNEHDMQGKLLVEHESISSDEFSTFYTNCKPVFEMVRSRLPVLRSEHRIAVGTLVNIHQISELIELNLRARGYLTYYWGTSLTLKDIKDKQDASPATTFVFSCMGVNTELNCFDEVHKVRKAFPDIKIIVGGAAFQLFSLLKSDPDNSLLTQPYKNPDYLTELQKALTIKEFVKQVFHIAYCESIEEIVKELDPIT